VRLDASVNGAEESPAGVFYTRYLPDGLREALSARVDGMVGQHTPRSAAGIEYPRLLAGHTDFIFYWRTLPWDHLPGSLMVREAGGVAAHFDGRPYTGIDGRSGLLIARSQRQWDWLQNTLALKEAS
jgi:fructose-1,6-bisphosphatase/inositol monophosphatase family enzyme